MVDVVQVSGGTSAGASHFVFTGQAGFVPPEHDELVSVWQIMSVPQSLSVEQGPGSQVDRVTEAPLPPPAPVVPPASVVVQSASGAHFAGVGGATVADGWQMYPCAQSGSLTQLEGVVANAGAARVSELIITKARRGLLSDMGGPFEGERRGPVTRGGGRWPADVMRRFQQNSCHAFRGADRRAIPRVSRNAAELSVGSQSNF